MTRTNHRPGAQAAESVSTPSRLGGALLGFAGVVLLSLALSPASVGAGQEDPGVAPLAGQTERRTDESLSGTGESEGVRPTNLLRHPEQRYEGEGRWRWRVPTGEWVGVALIGSAIAAWLLLGLLRKARGATLIESVEPRRWFDGRLVGSLAKDPLVWAYLLAAAGMSVAVYSGSFGWLSREATERVAGVTRLAPPVFLGLLGILFSKGAQRKMLVAVVEGRSNSLLELLRVHLDDDFHRSVSSLAQVHDVGLIQRTMWTVSGKAVDQGRLQPAEREEFVSGLLEIQPGQDDRSVYVSRQAALELATRLVTIEELEAHLRAEESRTTGDRRKSDRGPQGEERRTGIDRRVRSIWRPPGVPELDLAG